MAAANSPHPTFFSWLREYDAPRFRADLVAGITVGVILVPQGMAYALLAGVAPIYGLYASLIPLLVYAFLGSSRHLAVGIVAIDSLIVAAGIAALAPATSAQYLNHVFTLALLVGLIQILMGVLRFGFVVNLLSRPVIAGFMSAVVIVIGLSQLKYLLGIDLEQNMNVFLLLGEAAQKVGSLHVPTFALGLMGIVALTWCRVQFPRLPGPLLAVLMSTLAVFVLDLDKMGVVVVGNIPSGLPSLSVPAFSMASAEALLPTAITLALIQYMGVISLGKVFATRNGYQIKPTRELVVLGVMNVAGSFFQSLPVSGSYSRSAVNERSGARTPLANVFAALLVVLVLLFFTRLFFYLPIPIFAAIIMVSVFALVDVREIRFLLRTNTTDGIIALLTFATTISLGIHQGILLGLLLSVISVMYRISRPNVAVLGHLPNTRSFRDVTNHPGAHEFDDVLMIRIDSSFSFANADRFRSVIAAEVKKKNARVVILDATTVSDLDSTALAMLSDTNASFRHSGIDLYIAGAKQPVMTVLKKSGVEDEFGKDHFFLSLHQALLHFLRTQSREPEYLERLSS